MITELFRTKVGGRRPKGLICKRVTEFLKTSSKIVDGDDNFLFEYSKEEMNDQRPAEGKLKNKISKFIDQGRQKFQELRLKEIINNSDAHIIFEEDPIFNFLKCCQSENVSCLPFIKNLASKKLVLVDFKRLTPKVWQSLTESIELFEDLQIRHIFI